MTDYFLLRNMSTNENIPLLARSVILGRKKDCDIVVDSSEASRQHARIVLEDGRLTLEDLGSTNGTLLNRRRLRQPELLGGGDIIAIGQVHFMVVAPGSDSHMTILGGRLAQSEDNYVLEQSDPQATGMRMPFPMPPGWSETDKSVYGDKPPPSSMEVIAKQMQRQSIAKETTAGVLMITSDKGRNSLFPLRAGKSSWRIGRDKHCDVEISDVTISSTHAVIAQESGHWYVEDSKSTNGTRVNDRKVEKANLNDGDTLSLGKVDLIFQSISP